MFVIYIIMLALYGLLFILSKKETVTSDPSSVRGKIFFFRSAEYLLRRSEHIIGSFHLKRGRSYIAQHDTSVKKQLKLLNPAVPVEKQLHAVKINKIVQILILIFICNAASLLLYIGQMGEGAIEKGNVIKRNTYGQGSRDVELTADVKGIGESIDFSVSEQKYTDKELEDLFEKIEGELPKLITAGNEGTDRITEDVRLIRSAEGYPFKISWESDDYAVIDSDGHVNNEDADTDKTVTLAAVCTYGKKQWVSSFAVHVFPRVYTEKEKLQRSLRTALDKADSRNGSGIYVQLPERLDNAQVTWTERKENTDAAVIALFLILSVLVVVNEDVRLDKQIRSRQRQLMTDYPELVSKVTLYMSAGMSLRNIFFKMAEEYQSTRMHGKGTRYLYEEIRLTCNELQSGVQELQAYEDFSKRCVLRQYMRFGTLITQNLKKGSSDLLYVLRREADDSLEERKGHAKERGEEASTKLLLPMMMMLTVVMVIIIVPAFMSFSE